MQHNLAFALLAILNQAMLQVFRSDQHEILIHYGLLGVFNCFIECIRRLHNENRGVGTATSSCGKQLMTGNLNITGQMIAALL